MRVAVLGITDRPATYYVTKALIEAGARPAQLILDNRPSRPKDIEIWQARTDGRLPGGDLIALGVPAIGVPGHTGAWLTTYLSQFDLIVSAATTGICSNELLKSPRIGVLNVHPGMLPNYRGATCVEWAIYNDDQVCNTVHFMTDKIDEGPIVRRESYTFPKNATYVDVRVTVLSEGYKLLADAVRNIIDHDYSMADAEQQGAGTFHKPIPPDKMLAVLSKLEAGQYRYQFD
jgi:hypothetical protein